MSIANLIAERQKADELIKLVLVDGVPNLGPHGAKIFWEEMSAAAHTHLKQGKLSLFVQACQIIEKIGYQSGYSLNPFDRDLLNEATEKAKKAIALYSDFVELVEDSAPSFQKTQGDPVEESLEQIENIKQLAEEVIENCHSDRGIEFAEGAATTAEAIGETLEETGIVTDRQQQALDNIMSGLQNWIRD